MKKIIKYNLINNSKLSNNKSNTSLNSNTRYQSIYNTPENNSKIQNDMNKFIKKALDKKILNNIIFSSKQNKKEKEYNNKNKRSNIAQIEPYKSVNLNINLESPKQIFRNKKIFFSPKATNISKVKILENQIKRIKSSKKYKMYYNSRDKINTLREEKLSLENENNDLEEKIKKIRKKNKKNDLNIFTLQSQEEKIKIKSKLVSKVNSLEDIKKDNNKLENEYKNVVEETKNIAYQILSLKKIIQKMNSDIQNINNSKSLLIKQKSEIINQIELYKKKSEILKIKINKYENASNDLLYEVGEFVKSLND